MTDRGVPEWAVRELEYHRDLLYRILALLTKEERELSEAEKNIAQENVLLQAIQQELQPKLAFIKIAIGGIMPVGPATLTVGDKKVVSVLGFDQSGAPFTIDFNANPVTFTDDNEAAVQDTAGSNITDPITAVSPGVANIGASCAGFSDTEAVTVVAVTPKLSSIKISID